MQVAFRVDASRTIGAGHLMRCATLADELRRAGAEVRFFSRPLAGHYGDWLAERGLAVTWLAAGAEADGEEDARATLMAAAGAQFDWLVVDHYDLDRRAHRTLRAIARRVLVIDDLADREHDCELLLDQNLGGPADRYRPLLPPHARCLLGPRYALLRPAFAELRAQRPARSGEVRRLVVCFGGADPADHTAAALQALAAFVARLERVDVFAGAAYAHRPALADRCAALGARVVLHPPHADPAPALAQADLALGAGGTMNWERACLGVPTLAFGIADNQVAVLGELLAGGHLLGEAEMLRPAPARIAAWLEVALHSPALLAGLAERSRALVDGEGARRVAAELLTGEALSFRAATVEDSQRLHAWRNAPGVRAASLDPREISVDAHQSWLSACLADPRRVLLIAESAGRPEGVVRFDLGEREAFISVYRVPGSTGRQRLVAEATAWFHAHHPDRPRIVAEVRSDNPASRAVFLAAGYAESHAVLIHPPEAR